jgi:hypothetical protein
MALHAQVEHARTPTEQHDIARQDWCMPERPGKQNRKLMFNKAIGHLKAR